MYLPVWNDGDWSRTKGKVDDLKEVARLNPGDKAVMAALRTRQAAAAATVSEDQLLRVEALAVAPFATGLGNEHPLENGFSFLNPYGLPYLPGSGVKGVLRKAATELADGLFGDTGGWTREDINTLFGSANERDDTGQRGALIVWDVLPEIVGNALKVEVMTAHQSHYLQGKESPHESGQPNPINFLAVPSKSNFDFHIQCDLPFLARIAPDLAVDGRWQQLIEAALRHAFEWLGFGAKTAVGYGAMQLDPKAARRKEEAEAARRRAEERKRQEREREAELAAMSSAGREIQQCLDERPDRNMPEITAVIAALKAGRWESDLKREVALKVRERMLAEKGRWKETTAAKKPDKDKDYQNTMFVKRCIESG
jgi:CRISPR-associated protein Cmr6